MQFLYSIEWKDQYEGINFIPFQKDDYFTEKEHQLAIRQHNIYLRSLEMEVITIKNPTIFFQSQEGHSGNVLQWLSAQGVDGTKLFQHVTQIGVTKVLLSFYTGSKPKAIGFIKQLIPSFKQTFGDENTTTIFGPNTNDVRKSVSQAKLSHSKLLKARRNGNPQSCDDDNDDSPPPNSSNRGYYGKPPLQPTITNTKSFIAVATNQTNQPSTPIAQPQETNSKITELENVIKDMKSENEKVINDIKATKESISELSTKLNKRIDDAQAASSKLFTDFIDAQKIVNDDKERKDNEFKEWIKTLSKEKM